MDNPSDLADDNEADQENPNDCATSEDEYDSEEIDDPDMDYSYSYTTTSSNAEIFHPRLMDDIEIFITLYGEDHLTYQKCHQFEEFDLQISFSIDNLTEVVASAWNIDQQKLVTISLINLSAEFYLNSNQVPKVVCYQEKSDNNAICMQLGKIAQRFLDELWLSSTVTNESVTERIESLNREVKQLVEMGITTDKFYCRRILAQCNNDVNKAAIQLATEASAYNSCNSLMNLRSGSQVIEADFEESEVEDLQQFARAIPSMVDGFLVALLRYLKRRLTLLTSFCVICDEPHLFQAPMLKPMVCARPLCVFSYMNLGVATNVAASVASELSVLSMLVYLTCCSAASSRAIHVFKPFPQLLNPGKPDDIFVENYLAEEHLSRIKHLLDALPQKSTILANALSRRGDEPGQIVLPEQVHLVQWIISSNRSHIVELKDHQKLSFLNQPNIQQFLMLSAPPEKEAAFYKMKLEKGSCFAFHGSTIENWHSIIRSGLKNYSNTRMQINGAAYGSGIYLSTDLQISLTYCAQKEHCYHPTNKKCMALCEYIRDSETENTRNTPIKVIPDAANVLTRFLIVFDSNVKLDRMNISTVNLPIQREIERAVKCFTGN